MTPLRQALARYVVQHNVLTDDQSAGAQPICTCDLCEDARAIIQAHDNARAASNRCLRWAVVALATRIVGGIG